VRFLIVGAGGFAKEVADCLDLLGHVVVGFFDEAGARTHEPTGLPVVDSLDALDYEAATVAIGFPHARRRLFEEVSARAEVPEIVHPSASVSPHATVGAGAVLMQNVVVSADASVGRNTILNVGVYVAHDARVGTDCHIAPATQVSGWSHVGDGCIVGTGTIVLPSRLIGNRCSIGAGTIVNRDVPDGYLAYGVPVRLIREVEAP